MGYDPVAIELASLPNATLGSIAIALKSAGFTGVAIIGGFIGNERFDDSVAMLLKDFGFNARDAAENLHRARYSTENVVIALKALGYPLSEFFKYVNDNSTSNKVAILKKNGYSAVEIAKGLYANNTVDYWLLQALDQGGFTDLTTLLTAYYQSGQPRFWTLKDLYIYGRTYGSGAPTYRWQLIDIVKELQKVSNLSLVDLTDLINYANDNNYNQTFLIFREISKKEQDELTAEIPFDFEGTLAAYVPNFIALGVMKANGRSPAQAANILKSAGGVSDWKIAALNMFMSGYNIMDSIDALFNTYRTEIGIEVLMALFSSGFAQLIKDFDKYFKIVKFIVKQVAKRV